jgi:cytochrome c
LKKFFALILIAAAITACGGGEKKESTTNQPTLGSAAPTKDDAGSNPDYQKGLELIGKSDCLTCHKVKDKLIGPAYADVAAKYENTEDNIKMLAGKIIKGGKGVWGEVPMTPHPQITQADAEQMVKYILLLKK